MTAHTYNDKEYFDLKFQTLEEQMSHLTKLIEGNGKPGLLDRMSASESRWNKLYAVWGVSAAILVTVGVYIRSFIEELVKHVYGR